MLDSVQYKQAKLMLKKLDKEEYDRAQRGGVSSESEEEHDDEAEMIKELTVAEQLEAAMAQDDVNDRLKRGIGKRMKKSGIPKDEGLEQSEEAEDEDDTRARGRRKKKQKIKEKAEDQEPAQEKEKKKKKKDKEKKMKSKEPTKLKDGQPKTTETELTHRMAKRNQEQAQLQDLQQQLRGMRESDEEDAPEVRHYSPVRIQKTRLKGRAYSKDEVKE